jgi:DNA-binding transcriptional LysR family regulator
MEIERTSGRSLIYPPLDLRQVSCFVAAATAGTMTAAGEKLLLSQSAVSFAVRALERRLGVQLLVRRSARSLRLTPAGARFLPAARQLLAHADEVQRRNLATESGVSGPLTVGCFPTVAPFLLPGLIESFTALHPDVMLDFVEGSAPDLEDAMHSGTCDLAVVEAVGLGADIEHETLFVSTPYALFAADDPMARADSVDAADLATRDMIMFDLPPSRQLLERVFTQRGLMPHVRHRSANHELVRALVGRGLGFALLVTRPVHDLTHEGRSLAAVPLAGDVPAHAFALAYPRSARLTRQASAFAQHCREAAPALGRTGHSHRGKGSAQSSTTTATQGVAR